jgi:hypothetical protein
MHTTAALRYVFSTTTRSKTIFLGIRYSYYTAPLWRSWGGGGGLGHPKGHSPRGGKINILMKTIHFLGFRYLKLLKQIKISVFAFFKYIIYVRSGYGDCTPGAPEIQLRPCILHWSFKTFFTTACTIWRRMISWLRIVNGKLYMMILSLPVLCCHPVCVWKNEHNNKILQRPKPASGDTFEHAASNWHNGE